MVTVNPDLHLPLKCFSAISRFSTFGLLGSGGHLPHGKRDFDGRQGKDSSPCKFFFYKCSVINLLLWGECEKHLLLLINSSKNIFIQESVT